MLSKSNAKLTPPLQKLQTPSNNKMGRLSSAVKAASATDCQSQSTTAVLVAANANVEALADVELEGSMPERGGLLLKEAAREKEDEEDDDDGGLFRNERAKEQKVIDLGLVHAPTLPTERVVMKRVAIDMGAKLNMVRYDLIYWSDVM